ncbi:hypothetical protein QL285_098676 [Trifolium repens]|nr:hypothetical protein QL285_098676 [Trifolium repens]
MEGLLDSVKIEIGEYPAEEKKDNQDEKTEKNKNKTRTIVEKYWGWELSLDVSCEILQESCIDSLFHIRTHFLISKISNKDRHTKSTQFESLTKLFLLKLYKSISTGLKDIVWKADPIVEEKSYG